MHAVASSIIRCASCWSFAMSNKSFANIAWLYSLPSMWNPIPSSFHRRISGVRCVSSIRFDILGVFVPPCQPPLVNLNLFEVTVLLIEICAALSR